MQDMTLDLTTYLLPLFAVLMALLVSILAAIVAGSCIADIGRRRRVVRKRHARATPTATPRLRGRRVEAPFRLTPSGPFAMQVPDSIEPPDGHRLPP